jgi:hypothetical protein
MAPVPKPWTVRTLDTVGQKLTITPQMLGLGLVGARSARKPVCKKFRVFAATHFESLTNPPLRS